MAVCLRCGKSISSTAKFCGYCGYQTKQGKVISQQPKTNSQASNKVTHQEMSKEEIIHELDFLVDYFSVMQKKYDEYDSCNKWFDEKERQIRYRRRHNDDDIFEYLGLLFSGDPTTISMLFFTLSTFLLIAIAFVLGVVDKPYSILIAIGCSYFSSLFCFLGVYIIRKAKRQEREKEREMNNKLKSLVGELLQHYKNYGDCIVNFTDSNPRILSKIRENLVSGRADTLDKATKMARRQVRR